MKTKKLKLLKYRSEQCLSSFWKAEKEFAAALKYFGGRNGLGQKSEARVALELQKREMSCALPCVCSLQDMNRIGFALHFYVFPLKNETIYKYKNISTCLSLSILLENHLVVYILL